MAILKIKKYPDKILATPARKVNNISGNLIKLSESMLETMYFFSGVGLAANQVGMLEQLLVLDVKLGGKMKPLIIFNPEIVEKEGSILLEEGCLSFPGISARVKRPRKIVVTGVMPDEKEVQLELTGMTARVAQHEIDHLKGICFIDRVNLLKRWALKKEYFGKNKIKGRKSRINSDET